MNSRICECCQSHTIVEQQPYENYFHYSCAECGFEFFLQHADMIHQSLYEDDPDYIDDLMISRNYEDMLSWNHYQALRFIKKTHDSARITVLDMGCFNGFFVKKLEELGYNSYGVDFNNKAIEYGISEYGLKDRISTMDLKELTAEKKTYDVITAFEVLEHVASPRDFLNSLNPLIKSNGFIIVSVPNNNMLWRPPLDYPPHHLSRFNPRALAILLENTGFKPVTIIEQMSVQYLIRNYFGTFFRSNKTCSLRGGAFKHAILTRIIRIALNRSKKFLEILLYPLNALLHFIGNRYIYQVIIAQKSIE